MRNVERSWLNVHLKIHTSSQHLWACDSGILAQSVAIVTKTLSLILQCSPRNRGQSRSLLNYNFICGLSRSTHEIKGTHNFQGMLCDDEVSSFIEIIWNVHTCVDFTPVTQTSAAWEEWETSSLPVRQLKREKLQEQKLKLNLLAQFVELLTAIKSTPWILAFLWLPLPKIVGF